MPSGSLKYQIDYNADCGCDTVLRNFNLAYEKTFKNSDATKLLIQPLLFLNGEESDVTSTDDYTATVLSCANKLSTHFHPRGTLRFQSAAAMASPNTSTNATAIDSQMTYAAPDILAKYTDPVANITLYSQAAARSVLKSKGVDLSNSDYLKSKQWYDEVVAQMLNLGFIAKVATEGTVKENTYKGEIKLKDIVTELLSAYLGGAELSTFEAIANLIASDPDDTAITGFLDFWWSAASYHSNNSSIAWGPVSIDQGKSQTTAVYLNIDVSFQDWRSLFVSFHHEQITVTSSAITLDLDMVVYEAVEADILKALKEQIEKHIKHQKLDFGS